MHGNFKHAGITIALCLCAIYQITAPSCSVKHAISRSVPQKVDTTNVYLFYLHGGIVQEHGVNAVSEYYGPYKYLDILDTLSSHGYHVISERRPKGTNEVNYAKKVARQVDTLFSLGVTSENIVVTGASLGAYIAIEVAHILKNPVINYAILGLCTDYSIDLYSEYRSELCGRFLSISERSDQKRSCADLLDDPNCKTGYQELELNMGIDHAFLYSPYAEWIQPLVEWISKR